MRLPTEASGGVSLLTVVECSGFLAECGKSEAAADLQLLGPA